MTRLGSFSNRLFINVELIAYVLLGLMFAFAAFLGMGSAALSVWTAIESRGDADTLLIMIDRLLFVLMVIEILHTVRVSFRLGALVCEPFLVVGLIASIRRVLVITLNSSQVNSLGKWTPDAQAMLDHSMIELGVLGGLILIMVISIVLLRRTDVSRSGEKGADQESGKDAGGDKSEEQRVA
jgi:uncharacterized membrane protein (DUF373 family)